MWISICLIKATKKISSNNKSYWHKFLSKKLERGQQENGKLTATTTTTITAIIFQPALLLLTLSRKINQ